MGITVECLFQDCESCSNIARLVSVSREMMRLSLHIPQHDWNLHTGINHGSGGVEHRHEDEQPRTLDPGARWQGLRCLRTWPRIPDKKLAPSMTLLEFHTILTFHVCTCQILPSPFGRGDRLVWSEERIHRSLFWALSLRKRALLVVGRISNFLYNSIYYNLSVIINWR
jgi:hypothetical protein